MIRDVVNGIVNVSKFFFEGNLQDTPSIDGRFVDSMVSLVSSSIFKPTH
jgi:hypothetical protein